jgi:ribokinase
MRSNDTLLKVAVVGHVEWVQFARVEEVPLAGEVAHARDSFAEPAGGGAVAAVQLARLAGQVTLFTALGDDELGRKSVQRLTELGVRVAAAKRAEPTRQALTLVDDDGERTITTLGERLEPRTDDSVLPWRELAGMDAVYFTAGDVGALKAARAARVLVASPRAYRALGHGVSLDALVSSATDAVERREAKRAGAETKLKVSTEGERGGTYTSSDGRAGTFAAAEPPGPTADSYGCGDSFAAGLAYGLGAGLELTAALALAARCGAACLTGRGPYQHQLVAAEL